MPALGGATAAAEQLAFDVPEALPVVKPGGRTELGGGPGPPAPPGRRAHLAPPEPSSLGQVARAPGGHLPQLLPGLDQAGAEEGDPGEAQVLVGHEDAHRHQVGLAVVVDEAADVAIETRIDAVQLSVLGETRTERPRRAGVGTATATQRTPPSPPPLSWGFNSGGENEHKHG